VEQDAVPARPAVNRIPGVRDPATRAIRRPVREELAERLPANLRWKHASAVSMSRKTPQWSAERRASLIAKGGGALRKRAGVLATPRGLASPATLGASLPLISRALRAAATRTAARSSWRVANGE